MLEHWTNDMLRGAPTAFQRAAREYAEEYASAAVAAERERWAQYCHEKRQELMAALSEDDEYTRHGGVADGWGLAAVALRKLGPNVEAKRALPEKEDDERKN